MFTEETEEEKILEEKVWKGDERPREGRVA